VILGQGVDVLHRQVTETVAVFVESKCRGLGSRRAIFQAAQT